MIGRLTGKIEILSEESVIVEVGGVGYLVFASRNTISKLVDNEIATLFIETHVREELINLYGFISKEEKFCFLKLNLVSGVGTKVALAILSTLSPQEVSKAIVSGDKMAFKQVSGVGMKLAERIILELKDKAFIGDSSFEIGNNSANSNIIADSVSALANLGITKNDAYQIVSTIISQNPHYQIDEVIREALKRR